MPLTLVDWTSPRWNPQARSDVHADAIIFDLRENGGGQPAMVTLIVSYLFDQPTP
jgi:C-terminal processing protease CtpA/Prc